MTVLLTELIAGSDENSNERSKTPVTANGEDQDHHRSDEQVNICLECMADSMRNLKRRFLRLSSQATIMHLKKFIALKLYNNLGRFKDVSYSCVVWLCRHCTTTPGVLQDVLQLCVYVIMVHYKTWGTLRCVTFVLCVASYQCTATRGVLQDVTIVSMSSWCTTTPGVLQDVLQLCLCHHGALQHLGYFKMCYSCVFMSLKCTATPGVLQDVLQLCVYVTAVHCNTWGNSRCVTVVLCVHDAVTVVFCLSLMSLTLK